MKNNLIFYNASSQNVNSLNNVKIKPSLNLTCVVQLLNQGIICAVKKTLPYTNIELPCYKERNMQICGRFYKISDGVQMQYVAQMMIGRVYLH